MKFACTPQKPKTLRFSLQSGESCCEKQDRMDLRYRQLLCLCGHGHGFVNLKLDEWSDILAPGSFFAGPNNLRGTNLVGSNRTQILFSPATRQLRAIDKIRENESNLSTSDGLSFIVLPNIGQVKQPTGLHLRSQPFSISTAVERMRSPLWTWKS